MLASDASGLQEDGVTCGRREVLDEMSQANSALLLFSPPLLVICEGGDVMPLRTTEQNKLWLPVGGCGCCGQ